MSAASEPLAVETEQSLAAADILDSGEAGRRYLRGGSMRLLAYGAGLLVGFAATPFVIRHLGSVGWGRYVTVTSLIFIVAAITEGGLGNLGVRELSTAPDAERREYMSSLIGLRIALTLLGALGALAFAVLAGYQRVLLEGTAIACLGLLFTNLQVTYALPLIARLKLEWLAVNDFVAQAVIAAAMLTLFALNAPLLPFFAVLGFSSAVTLIVTGVLVRHQIDLRPAFQWRRWRALLSESLVYAAATALGVVYFRIVVIAVNLLSSATQTGYFGLSFRVLDIVNAVPGLLIASAFPILARAARDDHVRLRYALQRLFEGGLILGGWIGLGLFVCAPFIVAVVGGEGFAPSVDVLRILGAGVAGTFLASTYAFALLSLKRYRALILVNAAIVAIGIALCLLLIPAYGAKGAAVVTATLEVVLATGYAIALMRNHTELHHSLAPVPRIALAIAVAFVVGAALPVHPVLAFAAASAVLALLLAALGAVPAELLHALRSRSA